MQYAIKISKLTDANRKYLLIELDILRKLQSPFIVAVNDGFIVGSNLWLVMEHCIGGSILDVLKLTKKETLDEPLMKGVIGSLLLALDFLHGHHIIHRVGKRNTKTRVLKDHAFYNIGKKLFDLNL